MTQAAILHQLAEKEAADLQAGVGVSLHTNISWVSSLHQVLTYKISSKCYNIFWEPPLIKRKIDSIWPQTFLLWVSMQLTHRRPKYTIKAMHYNVDWTIGLKSKSFTCPQLPQSTLQRKLIILEVSLHSNQSSFSSGYHPSLAHTYLVTKSFMNVNGSSSMLNPMMHWMMFDSIFFYSLTSTHSSWQIYVVNVLPLVHTPLLITWLRRSMPARLHMMPLRTHFLPLLPC